VLQIVCDFGAGVLALSCAAAGGLSGGRGTGKVWLPLFKGLLADVQAEGQYSAKGRDYE
jgi:hypothetical protein